MDDIDKKLVFLFKLGQNFFKKILYTTYKLKLSSLLNSNMIPLNHFWFY